MEKSICNSSHSKKAIQPLHYLSRAEAAAIEKELLEEFRFGHQQLIEIWGHASAMAVTKRVILLVDRQVLNPLHNFLESLVLSELGCLLADVSLPDEVFPRRSLPKKQPTLLVICGCEQNGAIGLACARHLRVFEYEPTIFYPKRSSNPLYRDFTTQCEKIDIPFLSYLPTEIQLISDAYNLVVDAMLGVEDSLGELSEPYCTILATLKQIRIPLISLDVPSGWDVETGSSDGISPDVLVSLAAPKQCATRFMGKHHLVAGRFLPYDVQKKFELNLPEYPGTECVVAL